MAQIPFPQQIPEPVRLTRRSPYAVFGNAVLAATFIAVFVAGGLAAVRSGAFEVLRSRLGAARGVHDGTVVQVLGTTVPEERFLAALEEFIVLPEDLPRRLGAYVVSEEETGVTDAALGGHRTVATQQTVFVGAGPLDVFQSRAYLFSSEGQAARAFVQATATDGLGELVGQPVVRGALVSDGQGGLLFREPARGSPAVGRTFAGGVLLSGRAVHLVFGFFPLEITDGELAALAAAPVARYESVVGGRFEGGGRDADADGLSDAIEASLGTDGRRADTDADGYDDLTEVQNGFDPLGPGRQPASGDLLSIPGLTL